MNKVSIILGVILMAAMPLSKSFKIEAASKKVRPTQFQKALLKIESQKGDYSESKRLKNLLDLAWEAHLSDNPETATTLGRREYNHRWTDNSLGAIEAREREEKSLLTVLNGFNRKQLNPTDQLNYDLYKYEVENQIQSSGFDGKFLPLNQMDGFQIWTGHTLAMMPLENSKDLKNYLSRLEKIPTMIRETQTLMEIGLKKGVVPSKIPLSGVSQQLQNHLVDDAQKSPWVSPLLNISKEISQEDRAKTLAQAESIFKDRIVPILQSFKSFFEESYLPKCRETFGWSDMPNGKKWYLANVKAMTTTDYGPDQIHEIGLQQVERIEKEMHALMDKMGGRKSIPEFVEQLNADPKQKLSSPEDMLDGFRLIGKRIDEKLPGYFKLLPRMTYGVKAVPAESAENTPAGYYEGGSIEVGRPGYFYANTSLWKVFGKWEMETLMIHETVPGHHLQVTIAQELKDVPEFRKNTWYTAYGEGWALYAEHLGHEMGLFSSDASRFGYLASEMLRAARLVVDTGLHWKGWSRDQALAYFKKYTGESNPVEIDRYIVWPAQALGYKIGEIEIKRLREESKKIAGKNFDLRDFHDVVLGAGGLPLKILEKNVITWAKAQAKKKS